METAAYLQDQILKQIDQKQDILPLCTKKKFSKMADAKHFHMLDGPGGCWRVP